MRLGGEEPLDPSLVRFLNRLSDALFVLARWMAKQQNQPEFLWQRDLNLDFSPEVHFHVVGASRKAGIPGDRSLRAVNLWGTHLLPLGSHSCECKDLTNRLDWEWVLSRDPKGRWRDTIKRCRNC